MNVALVYDRVNKWGGAERVLLALHKLFPTAPLFTSVYNAKSASWAEVFTIKHSFLQTFPAAASSHEYYAPFMPVAFETFSFDSYDLVISVTSEAAKGIITKPPTKHLCYCLTPTRYLWSGYHEYFRNSILKTIANPALSYLRAWDKIAAQRPDEYIAISKEVGSRIKKYYGRDAVVVYPPVEISNFQFLISNKSQNTKYKIPDTPYFLVVSRLVPYKRIDLAIAACNELGLPLKIVGTGSQEQYLKRISGSTIEFVGNLTDQELVRYYKGCSALLFPGYEDLGLTMIEAQSFGKPVIAYKAGGALEIVNEGKTGEFFIDQSVGGLVLVLKMFDPAKYAQGDCQKQAEKFSFKTFEKNFTKAISKFI